MEAQDITDMKKNRDNREYVIQAVKTKGKLPEFAIPAFQDDEELVKEALKQEKLKNIKREERNKKKK